MIYLYLPADQQVWMFTLYGKNDAEDLTPAQKAQLRTAVEMELKARQQRQRRRRSTDVPK